MDVALGEPVASASLATVILVPTSIQVVLRLLRFPVLQVFPTVLLKNAATPLVRTASGLILFSVHSVQPTNTFLDRSASPLAQQDSEQFQELALHLKTLLSN